MKILSKLLGIIGAIIIGTTGILFLVYHNIQVTNRNGELYDLLGFKTYSIYNLASIPFGHLGIFFYWHTWIGILFVIVGASIGVLLQHSAEKLLPDVNDTNQDNKC